MIVLFISECEKSAWTRTRRILSRYAVQIGRRSWMARMSQEGLNEVRKELGSCATRNTAVACHRVLGRNHTELCWVVGTKRFFGASGEFAFSYTEKSMPYEIAEQGLLERSLRHAPKFFAYWHDMGKYAAPFQKKLKNPASRQSDPIRHERISILIPLELIERLKHSAASPTTHFKRRQRRSSRPAQEVSQTPQLDKLLLNREQTRLHLEQICMACIDTTKAIKALFKTIQDVIKRLK